MRHPKTWHFLRWFGPAVVLFVGGVISIVIAAAAVWPKVADWAEGEFAFWWPIVTSGWFIFSGIVVIALYLAALFYAGYEVVTEPRLAPAPRPKRRHLAQPEIDEIQKRVSRNEPEPQPLSVFAIPKASQEALDELLAEKRERERQITEAAAAEKAARNAKRQQKIDGFTHSLGLLGARAERLEALLAAKLDQNPTIDPDLLGKAADVSVAGLVFHETYSMCVSSLLNEYRREMADGSMSLERKWQLNIAKADLAKRLLVNKKGDILRQIEREKAEME